MNRSSDLIWELCLTICLNCWRSNADRIFGIKWEGKNNRFIDWGIKRGEEREKSCQVAP